MGPNVDEIEQLENSIREAWLTPDGQPSLHEVACGVLADVVQREGPLLRIEDRQPDQHVALFAGNPNEMAELDRTSRSLENFAAFMTSGDPRPLDDETSLAPALQALPWLCLELARAKGVTPESLLELDGDKILKGHGSVEDVVEKTSKGQKKAASLLAVGLLADGAVDGKIDSIPNLLKALGLGGLLSSSGVLVAAGAVFTVVMGVHIGRQLRRRDIEQDSAVKAIFAGASETTVERALAQYDEAMGRVEYILVQRLQQALGVDAARGRHLRLGLALADCKESRTRLLEAIRVERSLV